MGYFGKRSPVLTKFQSVWKVRSVIGLYSLRNFLADHAEKIRSELSRVPFSTNGDRGASKLRLQFSIEPVRVFVGFRYTLFS
ncbi:hypothetical protein DPMN_017144 [Dreissena polymorpha]|uniref:Uncharacterized protein n=1 Tax=Dreissena polymorpha TaxID=45954 RepID=A0A9D4NET4_DREPO|nr:hypothetical protein DPMN_017144 [Dreissena polymorpha]